MLPLPLIGSDEEIQSPFNNKTEKADVSETNKNFSLLTWVKKVAVGIFSLVFWGEICSPLELTLPHGPNPEVLAGRGAVQSPYSEVQDRLLHNRGTG